MNDFTHPKAAAPIQLDPHALLDDPHARFAELRARHALAELGRNQYLVLRAADVLSLLTDPRTRQIEGPEFVAVNRIPDGVAARFFSEFFLFSNGQPHRMRRGLFARSFAHKLMQNARGQVRAVADRIVAELPRGRSFDFVDRMAARVPADMIAAILGLPDSDTRYFASLVYVISRGIAPVYPLDDHGAIEAATAELYGYVEAQLRARMSAPRDDLLSALVTDWDGDQAISFESLVFQILGLIIGGSDTTRAAFARLVSLLLERRADWTALRDDPALIPGAVAEGLRYDPSVGSIPRVALDPLEIGGILLPPGAILRLSTMSALRDPDLYADPDRFDIRRTDHPRLHLVFGLGPHRCIGEMLARIEMEESLAALLDAAPGMKMQAAPRMIGFGGIRQITPMPVRID